MARSRVELPSTTERSVLDSLMLLIIPSPRFEPDQSTPGEHNSPNLSLNSKAQLHHSGSIDVYVLRCITHDGDDDGDDEFNLKLFPEFASLTPRSPESGTCTLEQLRHILPIGDENISFSSFPNPVLFTGGTASVQGPATFDGSKDSISNPDGVKQRGGDQQHLTCALPIQPRSFDKSESRPKGGTNGRFFKDTVLRRALGSCVNPLSQGDVTVVRIAPNVKGDIQVQELTYDTGGCGRGKISRYILVTLPV
jgi:hypothetical protein